jgi:hypothetical protein
MCTPRINPVITRVCSSCGEVRPIGEFARQARCVNGISHQCKTCILEYHRKYRATHKRKTAPGSADRIRAWRQSRGRSADRENSKEWRRCNKHKMRAYVLVQRLLRNGLLTKERCMFCGDPNSEAHHVDYNDPANVMWLCRSHHRMWHRLFIPTNSNGDLQ